VEPAYRVALAFEHLHQVAVLVQEHPGDAGAGVVLAAVSQQCQQLVPREGDRGRAHIDQEMQHRVSPLRRNERKAPSLRERTPLVIRGTDPGYDFWSPWAGSRPKNRAGAFVPST